MTLHVGGTRQLQPHKYSNALCWAAACVTHRCAPVSSIQEPEGQRYSRVQTDEQNEQGTWPRVPGWAWGDGASTWPILVGLDVWLPSLERLTENEAAVAMG